MSNASASATGAWTPALIQEVIDAHKALPGAMLPILHAIQDRFGYIPDAAIPLISETLSCTRADIHGIITFYHHFRTQPAGRNVIHVCRAEACQAVGSRQLEAHIKKTLNVDYHQTTLDHEFTLEPVYCLGNCACGPSIRVNDDIHGRVTPTRFEELADELTTAVVEVK
ncbi:formate dehydrogenase subunit gamma [Larsenimonas salina]|uniref:formate dehydrogenase subunit gamma n=1 Tax=Larsenimonas salina TaxID=1295565 RepID=UPI002073A4EE|nr:formate dehydrogenase subunit gamma [Larsenimonas salina]MCM5705508.1 formate dehydrogenase subunit gamma [Larsenimonas salina]